MAQMDLKVRRYTTEQKTVHNYWTQVYLSTLIQIISFCKLRRIHLSEAMSLSHNQPSRDRTGWLDKTDGSGRVEYVLSSFFVVFSVFFSPQSLISPFVLIDLPMPVRRRLLRI